MNSRCTGGIQLKELEQTGISVVYGLIGLHGLDASAPPDQYGGADSRFGQPTLFIGLEFRQKNYNKWESVFFWSNRLT